MKIGVLSDTHLSSITPALNAILDTYFKNVDLILHAGDIVGRPVYEFLQRKGVEAVRGNMDEGELQTLLPIKKTLRVNEYRIGLIHGWGSAVGLENRISPEFSGIDCLVYGHSHTPANHWSEGVLLFNPGSAFRSRFSHKATIGILQINTTISGEIIEV